MDIFSAILLLSIVCVVFLIPTSKKPAKKFGEGLLNDINGTDWWKPGNGGDL